MKILKQLLFVMLIVSGGSLIANLSGKEKHDLIYSSGLPTTSIDQIQRNLSRLKEHGHLSAANKVQTILDTRRGAQSADTKSDQQLAATLAEIKQQLELNTKIDQLALQLQQSKQPKTQAPPTAKKTVTAEEIVKMSNDDMYKLFNLNLNITSKQLKQEYPAIFKRYGELIKIRLDDPFRDEATKKLDDFLDELDRKTLRTLTAQEIVNLTPMGMYELFDLSPNVTAEQLSEDTDIRTAIAKQYTVLAEKYEPLAEKDPLAAKAIQKIAEFLSELDEKMQQKN